MCPPPGVLNQPPQYQTRYDHLPCQLCHQHVNFSYPDHYRVLFLRDETIPPSREPRNPGRAQRRDPRLIWRLRIHTRCLEFVQDLSLVKLWRLVGLVKPTFPRFVYPFFSYPEPSVHGAFYSSPTEGENAGPIPHSQPTSLAHLFQRMPTEIQDMIVDNSLSRLWFILEAKRWVARTADDPTTISRFISPESEEEGRFIGLDTANFQVEKLKIRSPFIRLHLRFLGRRQYIHRVSDPADADTGGDTWEDFALGNIKYFAAKSDGIGVVDIAFELKGGEPHWILHNSSWPFATEISQVKDADISCLTIIRDSLKCRAIGPSLPTDTGPTPFLSQAPYPPSNYWVSCGYVERGHSSCGRLPLSLIERHAFSHFVGAKYLPLRGGTELSVKYRKHGGGLREIAYLRDEDRTQKDDDEILRCCNPFTKQVKFQIYRNETSLSAWGHVQIFVNGEWAPELINPDRQTLIREELVDNVEGIWWAPNFFVGDIHVGFVVSQQKDV